MRKQRHRSVRPSPCGVGAGRAMVEASACSGVQYRQPTKAQQRRPTSCACQGCAEHPTGPAAAPPFSASPGEHRNMPTRMERVSLCTLCVSCPPTRMKSSVHFLGHSHMHARKGRQGQTRNALCPFKSLLWARHSHIRPQRAGVVHVVGPRGGSAACGAPQGCWG